MRSSRHDGTNAATKPGHIRPLGSSSSSYCSYAPFLATRTSSRMMTTTTTLTTASAFAPAQGSNWHELVVIAHDSPLVPSSLGVVTVWW